jgi:hypothetical protein
MAGSCGWVSVSAETVSGLKAILGGLSLGRGIPFPRCRSILDEDRSDVVAPTREDQASGADGTVPRAGRRGGATPNPYRETPIDRSLTPKKTSGALYLSIGAFTQDRNCPPASHHRKRQSGKDLHNPRAGAGKARLQFLIEH